MTFKATILLLLTLIIVSCDNKPKKLLTNDIKAFSLFRGGQAKDDSLPSVIAFTILFDKDCVIVTETKNFKILSCKKVLLGDSLIDTLNTIIADLNFKSINGKKTLDSMSGLYCGLDYGFVESSGRVDFFLPAGLTKKQVVALEQMENKVFELNDLKSKRTNDTLQILKITKGIVDKYRLACPPPIYETVKFVPPIIKDEKK